MSATNLDNRSEEVTELLKSTPGWVLRWGISLMSFLVVCGIFTCNYIKYPDKVHAEITITVQSLATKVVAVREGKVIRALIKDGDCVDFGQPLLVMDCSENYNHIRMLEEYLKKQLKISGPLSKPNWMDSLSLGELTEHCLYLFDPIKNNLYQKRKVLIDKQLELAKNDLTAYMKLIAYAKKEQAVNLAQINIVKPATEQEKVKESANSDLQKDSEYVKKEVLYTSIETENSQTSIPALLLQINASERRILHLQQQMLEDEQISCDKSHQQIAKLLALIDTWKKSNLILGPASGTFKFHQDNPIGRIVEKGEAVCYIHPNKKPTFQATCLLPPAKVVQIAIGQHVKIKLDAFPYSEYGFIDGIVKDVSETSENGFYKINVEIPGGLTTSLNKTISYNQELKGTADIITQNLSVLDRFLFSIRKLTVKKI